MSYKSNKIEFGVNGKIISFNIINNLPETKGISIVDALNNWVVRTDIYNAQSFVDYINSKRSGYTAMTEEKYNRLINQK